MKVHRKFTKAGENPFETVEWSLRSSRISNPDGSVVFEMADAEVPASWSQLATDIMVSKYFRKAGVPQDGGPNGLASHDWSGAAEPSSDGPGAPTGAEKSARQVIHRLVGCWRHWGESHGYFDSESDAQAFYDELVYMLVHQMAAPNSPQWFNTGLQWAYGINGPAQGHWIADHATGEVRLADDAYTHPQPHACFIQSVSDDLVNEGGIMDLWTREARLFKYGSGTGTNFSSLRGENESLSGGGRSSGLMSFLKIGDRAAGAIKSGGTTRRAAKMVCLDMDHPDIEHFINWKVREEIKVAAMVEGLRSIAGQRASVTDPETIGETAARLGLRLEYDFNGEAYATVSGQNSNNSVRIPDEFFESLDAGEAWSTTFRTTGKVAWTRPASEVWDAIGYAAWRCADPGVQYDTTINAWHTCPSAGRINASNPCSEYMFLDDTACNLASLNVLRFYRPKDRSFDIDLFEHAVDLWITVLEISVLMASFPSRSIAELSWKYRTLGLGYANLGAMLMQAGVPYDSDEGRAVCAAISAVMTGRSYRKSAELAGQHGPFAGYASDTEPMLRVMRNHRLAAHGESRASDRYEGLSIRPVPIDHRLMESGRVRVGNARALAARARAVWDEAYKLGTKHGFRNAQVTVIAPTGTIGLLMDCDTTGVEPDFALVKFKKLAGGGYFKIANGSLAPALSALGYTDVQVSEIVTHILGTLDLDVPMPSSAPGAQPGMTFSQWLRGRGLADAELSRIEASLPGMFELEFAFTLWSLGEEAMGRLGLDVERAKSQSGYSVLAELGLSRKVIDALNTLVCGTQTIEGAPHVKDEHLPVFDCASTCGRTGTRYIHPEGHIRMMAAAQPFISGAISKTINLPNSASIDDIKSAYRLSWELGLKANALYRDGCKLSQPLNSRSDDSSAAADAEKDVLEAPSEDDLEVAVAMAEVSSGVAAVAAAASGGDGAAAARAAAEIVHRPMRRRLPDTRRSITHKFNIAGHEGYLTVGLYADGKPGELFITMAKEGSTIGGLMDSLGTATSVALQYGVPIESLVRKFTHQRFEPAGMTTNRDIPFAKSLVDYIFRWLGMEFIEGYRERMSPAAATERDGDEEGASAWMSSAASGPGFGPSRQGVSSRISASIEDSDETDHDWSDLSIAGAGLTGAGSNGAGSKADGRAPTTDGRVTAVATATARSPGRSSSGASGSARSAEAAALSQALEAAGDAPPCDQCGTITVRSGTCHKCMNCGNSMGCS